MHYRGVEEGLEVGEGYFTNGLDQDMECDFVNSQGLSKTQETSKTQEVSEMFGLMVGMEMKLGSPCSLRQRSKWKCRRLLQIRTMSQTPM
jgi:hypothetical protein